MGDSRIELVQGDITTLEVHAVVTAANESLLGGGGVDGAIHRAAGPALLDECREVGICPEGEARITRGYLLPARYIVHTVGPIWEGGEFGESDTLARCYKESLRLAMEYEIESIAFPCIATGVYLFPRELACNIAVSTVSHWLDEHESPSRVVFCCFQDDDFALYRDRLSD